MNQKKTISLTFILTAIVLYSSYLVAQMVPFAFWKSACNFTANTTINSGNYLQYQDCDWHISSGAVVTIDYNSSINIKSLWIDNGSSLTHTVCTTSTCTQVNLNISGFATIASGASIDVTGKGYLGGRQGANSNNRGRTRGNSTNGGAISDAGGSHGGPGPQTGFPTYDDVYNPNDYGAGGGGNNSSNPGGNGGGLIHLNITGALRVDGLITADGGSAATGKNVVGGGAGGTIWISCSELTSTTSGVMFSATGGGADASQTSTSSGGGGRIALYYNTLSGTAVFTSTRIVTSSQSVTSAHGTGSSGTFLARQTGQTYGDLYIFGNGDGTWNTTNIGYGGFTTALTSSVLSYGLIYNTNSLIAANELVGKNLVVNRSTISPVLLPISANDGSSSITVGSGNPSTDGKINADWYIDDYQNHFDNLYIKNSAYVYIIKVVVEQNMVVDGNSTIFAGNITAGSLSLTNTGMIYLNGGNETQYVPLIVTGTNMTVDSTSGVYGMRAGYPGAYGTGANSNIGMTNGFTRTGGSITNAGGSHGGYGGYESTAPSNIPTVPYGNYMQPSTPGSGGGGANGGGAGGGVIRINLTGTLTVNGYLMADGAYITSDNTGGGAGGSVWITADTISGTGQIRAIGGYTLGNAGSGSGGGGRIALYYRALAGGMSISNSHFSVQGGYGPATQGGGSGTLYVKTTAATYGDLYFDNGNVVPNYLQTPFPQLGSETFTNLTVKSKATVKQLSTVTPISATNTNIKNTGAILYVPDNGAANYGSWFNPGTVTLTSGGLITEY